MSKLHLFLSGFSLLILVILLPGICSAQDFNLSVSPGCIRAEPQVVLTWEEAGTNPVYSVLRKMEGESSFTEIATTTLQTYTDYGDLLSDKDYEYQVTAEETLYSTIETVSAIYCSPFLDPATTSCLPAPLRIILNWDSITGSLNNYKVYRKEEGESLFSLVHTTNSNFYEDLNVAGSTIYEYFIRGTWQDGYAADSATTSKEAPTCSPDLSISSFCEEVDPPGGPQVSLSWNQLSGVENYQIYRQAPGEADFSLLKTLPSTDNSYTDKLVESFPDAYENGGTVSYYLKAQWPLPGGETEDSSVQSTSILECSPFLSVESNCDEFSMRLNWTRTQGAYWYNVYRIDPPLFYQTEDDSYVDGLSLDICPGEICTLTYRVETVLAGGTTSSPEITKDIDCFTVIAPSPPPDLIEEDTLAFCDGGYSKIYLHWQESNNVYYYSLYRSESGNTDIPFQGYEREFVDGGVETGHTYTYWVEAVGQEGTSTQSTNSVTIDAVSCGVPSQPNLTLSTDCADSSPYIDLSWTDTTNTYSYDIYRKAPGETDLTLSITFVQGSPEFLARAWRDTNIDSSSYYEYMVRANGPQGVPPSDSDPKAVNTPSCNPTIPILTLTPQCNGNTPEVDLNWVSNGDNTVRYDIFREDISSTTPMHTINDPGILNWTDTPLESERLYEYKVEAVGHDGTRATQGWQSITTYWCLPPSNFTLNDPPDGIYCHGYAPWAYSYPWVDLSWTPSDHSFSYALHRTFYSGGVPGQTYTQEEVSSPFTDKGFGYSLDFDGYNDYVSLGDSTSLHSTGQISIETWIYPEICSSYYCDEGVIVGRINGYLRSRMYLDTDNGLLRSYIYGTSYPRSLTGPEIKFNAWNHIVYVYDGTNQYWYLNGNQETSNSRSDTLYTGSYSPRVGDGYYSDEQFKGKIDEVRIYSRALSPTEIAEHFNGTYNDESDLRGLWHFDEGSGNSVSDSSNNGNNGTISGSQWEKHGSQCSEDYAWQVEAKNEGGSTWSNATGVYTMPLCPPSKPGLVLDDNCVGDTSVMDIYWSYSINAESFEIYRDGILIKTINQADPEFDTRTWRDDNDAAGLTPGVTYTYWVKAIDTAGSVESDHIDRIARNCVSPDPPENLTANFVCYGDYSAFPSVELNWDATINADYYEVFRNSSSIATTTATAYSVLYPQVSVNSDYDFFVRAHGTGGAADSVTASIYVGYCSPYLPTVDNIFTDCESFAPVNDIYWSDDYSGGPADFNTEYYEVYRNDTGSGPDPGDLIISIASTSPLFSEKSYEDNTGLLSGHMYYYWVRSVGYTGAVNTSSSYTINTYNCNATPDAPTNFDVTTGCCQSSPCATSTWTNSPQDAYSYNIYREDLSSGATSTYSTRLSPFSEKGSYALEFSDTETYDYASISWDNSLRLYNQFSVEAWIYPVEHYNYAYAVLGNLNRYYNNVIYAYPDAYGSHPDQLRAYFRWDLGGGNNEQDCFYGPQVNYDDWNHIVYVYDGTNQYWYLDGVQTHSNPRTGNLYYYSWSYNPRIGAGQWSNHQFNGKIDEVRVYGRSLSEQEVSDHYNGIYNNELELRGAWHFDEGSDLIAKDDSGKGNDATLYIENWIALTSSDETYVEPLIPERTYEYYTKAFGVGTESDPSNIDTITAPSCGPAKPDLTVNPQCSSGNSQLVLDWSDDPNTNNWSVWKKRESDPDWTSYANPIAYVYPPDSSFVDIDVQSGITYEYFLEAFGVGVSVYSDVASNTAEFCYYPPEQPVIDVATSTCLGYLPRNKLEWQETDDTLSYNILRKSITAGDPDYTEIETGMSGTTTGSTFYYTDTNLSLENEGEEFAYIVRAVGQGTNNFADSTPASIETYACSTAGPFKAYIQVNFTYASMDDPCAVSLSWTDVSNADYYDLYRKEPSETGFQLIASTTATSTVDDNGITEYTQYLYYIDSVNDNGTTKSNVAVADVPMAPPGTFYLTAGWDAGGTVIELSWTAAPSGEGGPVDYVAQRDDTDDFNTEVVCSTSSLSCLDASPDSGQRWYRVVASNNASQTTDSNSVEIDFGSYPPIWREIAP